MKTQQALQAARVQLLKATPDNPDELDEQVSVIALIDEALAEKVEPVAYTKGHCKELGHRDGCQLQNVQCGYPDCDRRAIEQPVQEKCDVCFDGKLRRTDGAYVVDCPACNGTGLKAAHHAPALAESVEPVAWQIRHDHVNEGVWYTVEKEHHDRATKEFERRALYAAHPAPAPAPVNAKLLEALKNLHEGCVGFFDKTNADMEAAREAIAQAEGKV